MVKTVEPHKSSIGNMDANVMALVTYIAAIFVGFIPVLRYGAWLVPLVLYYMEKESDFVKFHAIQSLVLNIAGAVLGFFVSVVVGSIISASITTPYTAYAVFGLTGIIGLVTTVISIIIFIFAILAMVNAYKYKQYRIPFAGKAADYALSKFSIS